MKFNQKPAAIDISHYDQTQSLSLSAFHDCRVLQVPLALLVLLVQAVVVMTSAMMETSTGLISLAHRLLSDLRTMKLMPL